MQQHLPFTVLKPQHFIEILIYRIQIVATALTVYGIETEPNFLKLIRLGPNVATALTVYGIETQIYQLFYRLLVPSCNSTYRLRY